MSKHKLFLNSLSGTIFYIANIIVAFVMSPILVRSLGNTDYGTWELVMSVVGYMGILDLGIGGALLRQVAVARGRGDQQDLQETISTAMIIFLAVGIVAISIFLTISKNPEFLLGHGHPSSANLELVFVFFAANAGVLFPLKVLTGVIIGIQSHHILNFSRTILVTLKTIALYYLILKFKYNGLLILVVIELTYNIMQFIIFSFVLWTNDILILFSFKMFTFSKMKKLFLYGGKSALLLMSSKLQFATLPFIIGRMFGVDMIVYYAIPNRLIEYAKEFGLTVGFPLTPFFADLLGKDNHQALKSGWLTTAFALQGITLAMPIFLYFCGANFIAIWIGPQYSEVGQSVIYALLVGLTAEGFSPNARQILLATNQHGKIAAFGLFMSICSIFLAFLGASYLGVAGAALGSSVATVIVSCFTLYTTCRIMGLSLFKYFKKTFLPFVLPLAILGQGLWIAGIFLKPENYVQLVIQIVFGGVIYMVAVWWISFPAKIRKEFTTWIMLKIRRA